MQLAEIGRDILADCPAGRHHNTQQLDQVQIINRAAM